MKGRIGAKEIWASVLVSLIGRLVFLDPVTFVSQPGQSAWMMPLIALPVGLLMLLLAKKLSVYGGPTACIQRIFGKGLGRAVIVLWGVWLTMLMAISVGKMISVTRYYFFPLTDISQTALLYVAPMCLIAFGGAVCIARSARLVWGIPFIALLVLVGANLPNMDWSNVSPVLGAGLGSTVRAGLMLSTAFWTVLCVWFWSQETQMQRPTVRASLWALVFSSVLLSAIMLCMTASMGTSAYQNTVSPLYTIASNIDLGRFLQRLGPLFFFCWSISTFVSGAFALQIASQGIGQVIGARDQRPIIAGLSALILIVSILMIHGALAMTANYLVAFSAVVTPGLLAILWLVAKIRRLEP